MDDVGPVKNGDIHNSNALTSESSNRGRNENCVKQSSDGAEAEFSERENFEKIVNAFLYYKRHSRRQIDVALGVFRRLPEQNQKALVPTYLNHLRDLKDCIAQNYKIMQRIVSNVGEIFENRDHKMDVEASQLRAASEPHMDKLRTTLRQIVRDWSSEGSSERQSCYGPVIEAIVDRFGDSEHRQQVSILVPGAGLGRLTWDLARLGFTAQGNEFSLFMLFTSNFILNQCAQVDEHVIHPFIHQTCNNWSYEDQVRAVRFPDVDLSLSSGESAGKLSMNAGDFLEVYEKDKDEWDCVATVFFLDTAPNILTYLESIHRVLRPGGLWVNLGPLLYHFADSAEQDSVELPYSEVRRLVERTGFRIDQERLGIPCEYVQNSRSMLRYRYECVFLSCTKL